MMTTKLEQAARQALEALKYGTRPHEAIIALDEALAEQAEQEPVAWLYPEGLEALRAGKPWTIYATDDGISRIPVYLNDAVARRVEPPVTESGAGFESLSASPKTEQRSDSEQMEQVAEWEKLKDPQTLFVNLNRGFPAQLTHDHLLHLLNKTEQAEQEPVAWTNYNGAVNNRLKAAPVRTKDLTDDEIWKVIDTVNPSAHIEDLNPLSLCRAVAAAEREKFLNKLDSVSEKVIYETVKEAVLAEREACAKVCDKEMDDWDYQSVVNVALNNCAAAIRSRSANARARGEK